MAADNETDKVVLNRQQYRDIKAMDKAAIEKMLFQYFQAGYKEGTRTRRRKKQEAALSQM